MAQVGGFTCQACTMWNRPGTVACYICGTVDQNSVPKDLVRWEWRGRRVFQAYDAPSCLQLEEAYRAGLPSVRLTQGHFAEYRGRSVRFNDGLKPDGTPVNHLQVGCQFERPVRRPHSAPPKKEADWSSLVSLAEAGEEEEEECGICMEELEFSEAADPELRAVTLRVCSSSTHPFHRRCLQQWFARQSKQTCCPFCQAEISGEALGGLRGQALPLDPDSVEDPVLKGQLLREIALKRRAEQAAANREEDEGDEHDDDDDEEEEEEDEEDEDDDEADD